MSLTRVVAITGCDSGLGWAIAARSAREGLVTIAGMYQGTETKAAEALKKLSAHPFPLDVTKPESVNVFKDFVRGILEDNSNYRLHAIVNNAGVLIVGDYEWQTLNMIESTINVNLLGSMRMVSAFLPDLRITARDCASKPRIINVASHCGLVPLPSFAPYSASKAGVIAWTRALRVELCPHGLAAVAFIPGSFITSSGILGNQAGYAETMLENLNDDQKHYHCGKRIKSLSDYLQLAAKNFSYDSLKDENIIETFMKSVVDKHPKEMYKVESWRYTFYYTLLKLPLPEAFRFWLVKKFLRFP